MIGLVLTFALAACDGEPEKQESSAAPQDSITENQPTSPPQEPVAAAAEPVPDATGPDVEAEPDATEPEVAAEPDAGPAAGEQPPPFEGRTGDEPAAGGESIPPLESDDGEEAQATLAEPEPGSESPPEATPVPDPIQEPQPEAAPPAEPLAASPPSESAPAAKVPPTKPGAGRPAPETAAAVPPRKPERAVAARPQEPARPPGRKPPTGEAAADAPVRQVVAMAPAERLPSDPSVVPTQARAGTHPDLSQMLFKIQEVHFNPGSATLTPGGERKTLTASRFISDLRVRSIKVVGYTDTVGPTAFNQELALARAGSVASLLERAGVPADLIETVGMGETKMPMPTSDGISEPLNRCVGILVAVDGIP
ncbi:OmpA family protein [Skermanella mucosa]|uniref:OmpA family protein n=1 Tax=Skermanella mucosa TaxID=1789672 RepID=UPI001E65E252|nr:OmpA family protein [Skermanella mucosa]UEM22128.1 OmpA family protein [Skermanella mucosa]